MITIARHNVARHLETRTCRICGRTKPLEAFVTNAKLLGNRGKRCKACESRRVSEYKRNRKRRLD